MSEKSKGDTSSSSITPAPSRVVKNPLLSASVTGLTFEDFPNKPLLLPAAPPVVHAAPITPPVLGLGLLNREPKSLVTVGQNSDIDRDETLSEINLNSDENQPGPAQIDTNSNSLLEQNTNTDSILSQAASSFSALPSVASSVFSTFSKRIYSNTASRDRTPVSEDRDFNANPITEQDIQPAYTQHPQQQQQVQQQNHFSSTPPLQFGASTQSYASAPLGASNNNIGAPPTAFSGPPPPNSTQTQFAKQELPAEPPKLYTPSEVPNLNASSVAAPPPGGSNTYRLTAKKKIYAPIPGFSEATQQHQVAPILDPSIISAPITAPTQPASYDYPQPTDFYGQNQIPSKPEERKGGLFSISNLVPTGVLQNISGLVQSAAGTIAQTVAPDSLAQQQQQQQYQQQQFQPQASFDISFQPPSVGSSLSSNTYPNQPSQNFYTQPYPSEVQQQQVGLPALPPQTNFFTPTENQNPSDNPVIPVLTQLGFDQLASDINKAKIPAIPQLSENTVNEPKLEGTDALKATQGPENHPESNQLETNDSSATPTAVAAASEVSPILPGTELPAAAIVPGVVPAQIPLYDPIRPPTQPVSVVSNIFFTNNTSYPIRPITQPVPNIFSAPIRPPTQPAPNNFSAPIRPPTQPVPNIYSAPIRPPTQPVPSGFFDPIRPPTQPVPSGFYDPIRPPTQPNSAASNILTPNIFSAPIRPPTQPVSASKSTANAFEPIRPPSQPTPISTPNSTPGIFSAPIRPPSQPVSASNFSANTFEPIRPPSQPTPPISTSSVPGNVSAPIRPPSQPVSAVPLNSTPTNFFAPTGTPTQPFLDPIRPPTQPAPTTNFGPNIFSAPIRPPTQPTPVGATPANFDPIRPPTQSTAATNFTPNIFSAPIRPPTQPTPAGATPVNFFDSTRPPSQNSASDLGQQLPQPNTQLTSQQATASTANNIYQAPPLSTQVPPITQPPAASGPSSFRLQKGTRLYKNPLTSAETAPASIFAPSLQPTSFVQPPPVAPQSIFNPFAATAASLEQSPALFVPGTLEEKELKEKPCVEQQSPNLFALETSPLEVSKETQQPEVSQPIGFIDPNSFTSELKTQDAFLPNKEFQSTVPEQKPSIPNIIQQSEIKLPTPSDLVLSQPVQAVLETEAKNTTPLPFDSSSKVDDINANESSDTTQQEQALTENPDKSQTPEAKEEVSVNPTLRENNDDSLAASQGANFLPPPPQITAVHGLSNPYRKEYTASHTTTGTQPSLANFFTPIESDTSSDFNFFSTPAPTQQAKLNSASIFSDSKQITENLSSTAANFFQLQTPNAPSPSPQPTPSASPKPTTSSTTDKADPSLFPQLPSQTCIAPPPLFKEPPKDLNDPISVQQPTIAPPLGFDNLISSTDSSSTPIVGNASNLQSQELTTQQPPNFNSFSNFFNQSSNVCNFEVIAAKETERDLPNPTSFFDSFSPVSTQSIPVPSTNLPSDTKQQQQQQKPEQQQQEPQQEQQQERQQQQQQTNEDQRIQNFFNNPPPQELGGNVGDLNYDLVHGGLAVKTLQTRSLTPASILVEPPSSSCSEFSELNTSSAGQRQNVIIENSNKSSSEEEIKVQATIEPVNEATSENLAKAETVEDLSKYYADLPKEVLEELRMANLLTGEKAAATAPPATISTYTPAVKHWFYKKENCNKTCWTPFSHYDSALLETALTMDENNSPNIVAVEGGRFDVNIKERTKTAVYWEGKPIQVRRCSWFYKGTDSRYVPYEEETADRLEAEYKLAIEKDEWHKKVIISMGEQVVFHGPTVIVHFHQQQNIDAWGGSSQTTTRPRVVKRDLEDFHIEQGESQRVDHLLLMVHGIGSVCDLKMRTVEEVVDDFRSIAQQLVSSHYKNSTEMGLVGRVEILPISWHSHLHSAEMGIDDKLKAITLESIPKLRYFANDTLLDVLFYTSPTYCQKIMNTVANSMNSIYVKYRQRNPDFNGGVSVAGHSLGSLILFDMLCHQKPIKEFEEKENMENPDQRFPSVPSTFFSTNSQDNTTSDVGYMTGVAGTGQPFIHYEQLLFHPKKFFAIGSPIGVFVTIRGIDKLGVDFRLPTCPGFYNIFHPFDPIAYRIEALINPDMAGIRPVLIPHHKGRKRMHLELRETMTRVGADLKQRFMDTFRNTLDSVNFLGSSTSLRPGSKDNENVKETMEKEVDKVLNMQSDMDQTEVQFHDVEKTPSHTRQRSDSASTSISDTDMVEIDFPLGKLNDSKRIDYVLQEAPLEFFNEYLFALSSHVGYWESEDTILFVMKEIYTGLGVSPDSQVPQQSMTIERPSSRNTQHDHATTPT